MPFWPSFAWTTCSLRMLMLVIQRLWPKAVLISKWSIITSQSSSRTSLHVSWKPHEPKFMSNQSNFMANFHPKSNFTRSKFSISSKFQKKSSHIQVLYSIWPYVAIHFPPNSLGLPPAAAPVASSCWWSSPPPTAVVTAAKHAASSRSEIGPLPGPSPVEMLQGWYGVNDVSQNFY